MAVYMCFLLLLLSLWAAACQFPDCDSDGWPPSPWEDLHLQEADSLPQLDRCPDER